MRESNMTVGENASCEGNVMIRMEDILYVDIK